MTQSIHRTPLRKQSYLLINLFGLSVLKMTVKLVKLGKMHCYVCSLYDRQLSILYIVMERGEVDLAIFFRASKTPPDVLHKLINPCWMQMLYAVQALHEQGSRNSRYF